MSGEKIEKREGQRPSGTLGRLSLHENEMTGGVETHEDVSRARRHFGRASYGPRGGGEGTYYSGFMVAGVELSRAQLE